MEKRRALLIGDFGDSYLYAYETSHLLKRAGFDVDLVTNNPISGKLRSIGNYTCVDKVDEISRAALVQAERAAYELIVVLDDLTLTEIRNSNLSNDEKLILLPVQTEEGLQHIGSKNGLSQVLRQHGIRTPDFLIAGNKLELNRHIDDLGCPVFIKIDFSGAGQGVFECRVKNELESIENKISSWPVLLKKK